jgi:hypothetical protein
MSKGVLLYAFNNGTTDYLSMAKWSADRIEKYLGLPTTIISNQEDAELGGHRVFNATRGGELWYNASRNRAWDHSPYDQTIVLDVDYIVNSEILNLLFEVDRPFMIHQNATDITRRSDFINLDYFGEHRFPSRWATVMYFNRNEQAREVFSTVEMIKNNWEHYSELYKFTSKTFRNDWAFSIALGLLGGHVESSKCSIPWPLVTASTNVDVAMIDAETCVLRYQDHAKAVLQKVKGLDIHVMNKQSMEEICAGS